MYVYQCITIYVHAISTNPSILHEQLTDGQMFKNPATGLLLSLMSNIQYDAKAKVEPEQPTMYVHNII